MTLFSMSLELSFSTLSNEGKEIISCHDRGSNLLLSDGRARSLTTQPIRLALMASHLYHAIKNGVLIAQYNFGLQLRHDIDPNYIFFYCRQTFYCGIFFQAYIIRVSHDFPMQSSRDFSPKSFEQNNRYI